MIVLLKENGEPFRDTHKGESIDTCTCILSVPITFKPRREKHEYFSMEQAGQKHFGADMTRQPIDLVHPSLMPSVKPLPGAATGEQLSLRKILADDVFSALRHFCGKKQLPQRRNAAKKYRRTERERT